VVDRLRILYVQPNSEVGGSDICLLRLVRALDPDRYEPIVLLPGDGPMVPLYKQAGARVIFTPMRQLRTKLSPWYQLNYLVRFLPTVLRIAGIIGREKIDLVHSNSLYCPYGAFAAWIKKRPHLWHLRELPPQLPIATAIYAAMVRKLSIRIASMTRGCAERLFGAAKVPAAVVVLHDGIDTTEFSPDADGQSVRQELGVGDAPLIGFVARLDPWKGLDVFLRAASEVTGPFPEARFVVAGGAPSGYEKYAAQMRELATSLNLDGKMQFVGFRYGAKDMPRLMAALDIFCHTAIEPEPFGLVLIEAMACGRPVIAAKAGGPLEIVADGETGMLIPPGDTAAYAAAIIGLLRDPQTAKAMGAAGRGRAAELFSTDRFARDLDEIYRDIFGRIIANSNDETSSKK
jgi:glycosyltransferase involved in cell wall biosynthesis